MDSLSSGHEEAVAASRSWEREFADSGLEGRRLASELVGTFLLVVVGAGGGVVGAFSDGQIERGAAVTAPALMVVAIVLFMGRVSGAHLNPAVTLAFCLRKDFPWRRAPAYTSSSWSAPAWPACCCWRCSATSGTWARRPRAPEPATCRPR